MKRPLTEAQRYRHIVSGVELASYRTASRLRDIGENTTAAAMKAFAEELAKVVTEREKYK